jgi:hypothetical protein
MRVPLPWLRLLEPLALIQEGRGLRVLLNGSTKHCIGRIARFVSDVKSIPLGPWPGDRQQGSGSALIETNIPFGRVIAPLQPARRTLAADLQPHVEIILVHSAVILSKPGTALAFVKESYFSDLVALSAPSPLRPPVNESCEPSEVQNVGLAP